MPHFIVQNFNGKKHHSIEFFHDQSVDHRQFLDEVYISDEAAKLPLSFLVQRYEAGLPINFLEMG